MSDTSKYHKKSKNNKKRGKIILANSIYHYYDVKL